MGQHKTVKAPSMSGKVTNSAGSFLGAVHNFLMGGLKDKSAKAGKAAADSLLNMHKKKR